MKIFPNAYILYQSGLKTLPKTKSTLNILPKIFNIGQSGGISPNMVTLVVNNLFVMVTLGKGPTMNRLEI